MTTLRDTATDPSAGLRVQAAKELREWMKLAGLDPGEDPEDTVLDPREMSPQQRAAARARLLAEIARDTEAAQDENA